MKILLIGGTGCMGKPLTKYLLEGGNDLTLLNRGNVKTQYSGDVQLIVCDRRNPDMLYEKTRAAGRFDCVIDMLSFTIKDAESAIRAFRGHCGQYLFCSTVDVFQKEPLRYPIHEESERYASESFPYAFEKLASERILEQNARDGAFEMTIVRPAATYCEELWLPFADLGPPALSFSRLRRGKPIILHGDGTSIWIQTYADDVSRAIANAVLNKKAFGRSYNIMGDEYLSWRSYWRIIAHAAGAPEPSFAYIPSVVLKTLAPQATLWCCENFSHNILFDNTRAKSELGFKQTVCFEEGARRCTDWLLQHGAADEGNDAWYDKIIDEWNHACNNFIQRASTPEVS